MVFSNFMLAENSNIMQQPQTPKEATSYKILQSVSTNKNNTVLENTDIKFDPLDNAINKMNSTCDSLRTLVNALIKISSNSSENYDRQELMECIKLLLDKIVVARQELKSIIDGFIESLKKIKRMKPSSNNSSLVRRTDETFEECVKPIRDYLSSSSSDMLKSFNNIIDSCKKIYIENYNKQYISSPISQAQFEESFKDKNDFKTFVYESLTKAPIWFAIMHIGMFTPSTEKRLNYIDSLIKSDNKSSSLSSSENSNAFFDFEGCGIASVSRALDNLQSFVSVLEKNIYKGKYNFSINDLRGGEPAQPATNNRISDASSFANIPKNSQENYEMRQKILTSIVSLQREISSFIEEKTTCIAIKNTLSVFLNRDASICSLCQAFMKYMLNAREPIEMTTFMTSDAKVYYQIILRKIKNDSKFNAKYSQYLPAIQYVLSCLNEWFLPVVDPSSSTDQQQSRDLFQPVSATDCTKTNQQSLYFDPRLETDDIQFVVHLLDALNTIVIKPYTELTGTTVTAFCIINDFRNSPNDKIIYKRVIEHDSTQVVETVSSTSCPRNTTIINSNGGTTINPQTIKIPFTYIFDRCDLSSIPRWIKLSKEIEKNSTCMITFGYSGTGKSVSSMGKFIPATDNRPAISQEGILQYCLQTLKLPFKVEVLEIYGRALPTYESFNLEDPNGGLLESISWIKRYTSHKSVTSTGKYDEKTDIGDSYDNVNFDYKTDEQPGSLIKDPQKIKEYFKDRLSLEFFKNPANMYSVKEENISTYLQQFSYNLVEPVERKRRQLRTIFFTPNNPDSSRSILIYTLAFEIQPDKYTTLTIIDFPGKEDPLHTYVYDIPRDLEHLKEAVIKNYDNAYSRNTVDLYMKKYAEKFTDHDTFLNLMVLNPMLLLGMSMLMNVNFINKLNNYIKTKNISPSKISEMVAKVGDVPIDYDISMPKLSNLLTPGIFTNATEFPQIYDWTQLPIINNQIIDSEIEKNLLQEKKDKSLIFRANLAQKKLTGSPNVLRQFYITQIIKVLLESDEFNNSDVVIILLQTLNYSLNNNNRVASRSNSDAYFELSRFFGSSSNDESMYICDRLNNVFEAYFINELVADIVRDITEYSHPIDDQVYNSSLYQGDKLKISDESNYILKRLFSVGGLATPPNKDYNELYGPDPEKFVGSEIYRYNAIINPVTYSNERNDQSNTITLAGKIYMVPYYSEPAYLLKDDKDSNEFEMLKKAKLKEETSKLYDYSKCISEKNKNKIFDVLKISPKQPSDKLTFYFLYVLSNVQSDQKCSAANTLLESMFKTLQCITNKKCD